MGTMSPMTLSSSQRGARHVTALAVALCAAAAHADTSSAALCFALDQDATADLETPQWRELIPAANANGIVQGRDGRWWRMTDPKAVAGSFDLALPVDINHASELAAPKGGEAPARGWVEALEVRNGAIWGRIAWNADGRAAVADKKYRFLSPVFRFDPKTHEIQRLTSVALVNEPNFNLALNRASDQENPVVDEAIRKALGLSENATADQAVTAINALRDTASASTNIEKYVPRADYNTALNRATAAEAALATHQKAQHQVDVDAAIDAALKAGKITPATVEYHKACCAAEGGLARFKAFAESAPVIAADSGLSGRATPNAEATALNAATKTVAQLMGNTEEDIRKYGEVK